MEKSIKSIVAMVEDKYRLYTQLKPNIIKSIVDVFFDFPIDRYTFASEFSNNEKNREKILRKFHKKDTINNTSPKKLAIANYIFDKVVDSGMVVEFDCKDFFDDEQKTFYISPRSSLMYQPDDYEDFSNLFNNDLLDFAQKSIFLPSVNAIREFTKKYYTGGVWAKRLVVAYYNSSKFRATVEAMVSDAVNQMNIFDKTFYHYSIKLLSSCPGYCWDSRDIDLASSRCTQHKMENFLTELRGGLVRNHTHDEVRLTNFHFLYTDQILAFGASMATFCRQAEEAREQLLYDTKDILALIGREAA